MRTSVLLGASLLLGGCFNPSDYPTRYQVYIDPAFGSQVNDVVQSLTAWEDSAGVRFDLTLADITCDASCGATITLHPDTLADIVRKQGSPNAIGTTQVWGNDLGVGHWEQTYYPGWANVYTTPTFTQQTLLHEIGHAMGLVHSGAGSLMCANTGCAAEGITGEDINQYRTLRGM
jgi:predicted Zn-dependent protease